MAPGQPRPSTVTPDADAGVGWGPLLGTSGEGAVLVSPGRDPQARGTRGDPGALPAPLRRAPDPRRVLLPAGAGGATVAAAAAKTRHGSASRGRAAAAAPVGGSGAGRGGRGGAQRAVALLRRLSSLSSSQSSAAGLTWPERPRLREGARMSRASRPDQGHGGHQGTAAPGHATHMATLEGMRAPVCESSRAVVPVGRQGLRVVVLLPARRERG